MKTTSQYAEFLALGIILALGAWLRFQNLGDIEYNIDQAYPIWQAIQTLDNGEFPLAGQGTSVLFANPPLTGYFFVLPLALARQIVMVYAFTLLLNTFAVVLAYRALRGLLGTRPALIGAALFAANPWIVEDSRRTWVQSLTPFFVALVFWALVPVLTGKTHRPRRHLLVAIVGLALFAHTYLLAYALVAPVAILLLVFWRLHRDRIPWRPLAVGGVVFAVLAALFAAGLIRDWDATRGAAEDFAAGESRLSDEALGHAIRLVTGHDYAEARGQQAPADDASLRSDISDILHVIWLAFLVAGISRAVYAAARMHQRTPDHERDAALILVIWFAMPVVMMSYVSRVVHPFYLLLTVPAGHGLAAFGAVPLLRYRAGLVAIAILVIITGAANGLNAVRFAQNTAAFPGEDLPETLPLAEATALGQYLREAGAPDLAVFSPMQPWTPVTLVGRDLRAELFDRFDRALIVPPEGGLYVQFRRAGEPPLPVPIDAIPVGERQVLADRTEIAIWRAFPQDLRIARPADIPSDVDVTFAGWRLSAPLEPGRAVELITYWQIEVLHSDRGIWSFAPFAHLYDASGQRIQIAEGAVIPALKWQAGDLMLQRIPLQPAADAAGPFVIHVGLFDSVRLNPDGVPGINAIFRLADGDETRYTADIALETSPGVEPPDD